MIRLAAVMVLISLAAVNSRAQSFFAVQGTVAEPTESFRQTAGTGYGVYATYIRYISPHIAISGASGYVQWGPRSNAPPHNDIKIASVPLIIGVDLLLVKGSIAPYVGVGAGVSYLRVRGIAAGSAMHEDKSELKFTFSPHVGAGVHLAGPLGLLVTGSYNVISTPHSASKYFGLHAGLAVGF